MFEFWREATAVLGPGLLCQSERCRPENVSILSSLLIEARLEFKKRGIFFTVDEKLLQCNLFKLRLFQQRDDNSGSPIFWNVTTEKRTINNLSDRSH